MNVIECNLHGSVSNVRVIEELLLLVRSQMATMEVRLDQAAADTEAQRERAERAEQRAQRAESEHLQHDNELRRTIVVMAERLNTANEERDEANRKCDRLSEDNAILRGRLEEQQRRTEENELKAAMSEHAAESYRGILERRGWRLGQPLE
jgi:hypothetical protein